MRKKDKKVEGDMGNSSSFIPGLFSKLVFDIFHNWIRDYQHNKNIKKNDVVEEKLITVENLTVKLEKRVKENKYKLNNLKKLLVTSMVINFLMSAAILVFLFLQ